MPTYYAQAAGAIQSVVWDTIPTGGGSTLTWPPAGTDTLDCNGKAITWAAAAVPSLTAAALTTTVAGGTITLSGNTAVAISANILNGVQKYTFFVSNHTGTGANAVTLTGSLVGGEGQAYKQQGVGTLLFTGDVTGGSGTSSYGLWVTGNATVSITGNVTGGSAASAVGVFVATTAATASITINGNVTGGSDRTAFGVQTIGAPVKVIGSLIDSATCSAAAGKIYWQPASVAHYWQVAWNGSTNQRYTIPPLEGNVRFGVNYGYGGEVADYGTLYLPAMADVKAGVGYGDGGTEYTGTLVAGGGGVPLIGPGGLVG